MKLVTVSKITIGYLVLSDGCSYIGSTMLTSLCSMLFNRKYISNCVLISNTKKLIVLKLYSTIMIFIQKLKKQKI